MFWTTFSLLVFLTSCATMKTNPSHYDVTYKSPSQGPQMDLEAIRDHRFNRVR